MSWFHPDMATAAAADTVAPPTGTEPAPAEAPSQTTPRTPEFYANRRRTYITIAVAVVIAGYLLHSHHATNVVAAPAVDPATKTVAQGANPPDVTQAAQADITAATTTLAGAGTLTGFAPAGTLTAAAGKTAIITRQLDGTCWYYGLLNGGPTPVHADDTGKACEATTIAATQAALTQAATDQVNAGNTAADAVLSHAAQVVQFYASRTFDSAGHQTLTGLPNQVGDARVISASANLVVLQAVTAGACRTISVASDGTTSAPATCN